MMEIPNEKTARRRRLQMRLVRHLCAIYDMHILTLF